MMRYRFSITLACLVSVLAAQSLLAQTRAVAPGRKTPVAPLRAAKPAVDPFAAADKEYLRKNYKQALGMYRDAQKRYGVPQEKRGATDYRIARCLGYMELWDEAIAESLRVGVRYPGTIWEARAKSWLMRLYLKAPHEGWKVGDRFYRGEDAPETDAATPPVSVDLTSEDWRKAVLYGEQSKVLYARLRDEVKGTPEEADMAADLARTIAGTQIRPWGQLLQWKPPTDDTWKLAPDAPYDVNWAPPKKVLHLFLLAEEVGTKTQKPVARLAQAVWLRTYQSFMSNTAWRQEPKGERKRIPYPYQDRLAVDILRTLPRDFPEHAEADHALLTVADWFAEDEQYTDAIAAYEALAKSQPDTKWGKAAANAIAATTRVEFSIRPPAPQPPGKKAVLDIEARNVAEVKLAAYSVKLEELVKDARVLGRPREGFSELFARLGKAAGIRKFYQGDPVTWSQPLPSKQHAPVSKAVETPLTRNGAYVVEADAGAVKSYVILVISDLAVVQLVDAERVTAMTVNAQTGVPVADASVVIRELCTVDKKPQVSAVTLASNEDGLAEKPLAPKRTHSDDIRTFAWKGDRYAYTAGTSAYPDSPEADRFAYTYTDRAVYRPGQKVFFRGLVTSRKEDGSRAPLVGEKAQVRLVTTGGGGVIESREATTNEFGSINGTFQLGSQSRLGPHVLVVALGSGKNEQIVSRSTLWVEEYKRPEFQVTVAPAGKVVRAGEPLSARIAARYYFGAPVANAKVKYTVVRFGSPPGADTELPAGLRKVRDSAQESEPDLGRLPIERVSGEAVTDANGEALVSLDTVVKDVGYRNHHLRFDITAEVTDASRRTIEGAGNIRAPATQFDATVSAQRGFFSAGPVMIDVRTETTQGEPIAASGVVRFARLIADKALLRREPAHSVPVRTDGTGRGTVSWNGARAGRYEVQFEAIDAWDRKVTARTETWVAGDEASSGVLSEDHVELVPELRTFAPGQSARVLLVSDAPGMTVLLTHEAGERLLQKRVTRLSGGSNELEIPVQSQHSPDLVVAATGVHRREFFRAEATLQVLATQKRIGFEITPDKSTYQPGEQATLKVRARDADGRPVRVECSLGATDGSLGYIANDSSPPIFLASYGVPRGSDLYPEDGLAEAFEGLLEDSQPPLKEDRPDWSFPTGLGNIEPEVFAVLPGWMDTDGRKYRQSRLNGAPGPTGMPPAAMLAPASPSVGRLEETVAKIPRIIGSSRSNFVDQAFWMPAVVTDANGEAVVTITWPDNITRWDILARGWSESAQVGEARAQVTATKNLLVRLQSPRFFVERDELVLSANVHNYTETAQSVRVALELGGDTLYPAGGAPPGPPSPRSVTVPRSDRPGGAVTIGDESTMDTPPIQTVDLPAGAEKRVDWRVRVERPGTATVRVLADAGSDSDAVELKFPVLAHGVEKLVVKGGSILMAGNEKPGTRSEKVTVTVPAERAPDAGELIVQISPSAAMVMLDALPYLGDYPYGCTEQTMSRFMPAVVSAKTLKDLGVDLDDLRKRAAAGEGPPSLGRNPVFKPELLKSMIAAGLDRLRRFQHKDGGWGWWEQDASDPIITAYVLEGLIAGRSAEVAIPASMVDRGMAYLASTFAAEKGPHDKVYQAWVLTLDPKRAPAVASKLLESSFPGRERLSAYGLALLSLALKNGGKGPEARLCMQNLESTAKIDREAGTCSWRGDVGRTWDWHNNDVETAAACLRAFQAIESKHRLAPLVVRWLANNRTGASWSGTRDTAHAVYALAEYVSKQKVLAPDYTVTVDVSGRQQKKFRVTAQNALTFDNRLVVPSAALGSGAREITVTREGQGNVYFTAALRVFTLEEGIQGAGNEIRVRRRYFRLTKPAPGEKPETTKDGYVRTAVSAGDRLSSGDLMEVELLIESKNTYEHLVFEDMKPAGCEPVEVRSGTRFGNGLCSNVELRDDRVAFFITQLPQGKRLLSYRLRAETPGAFHALPLTGYAMYAPRIRCISDEANLRIEDAPTGDRAAVPMLGARVK